MSPFRHARGSLVAPRLAIVAPVRRSGATNSDVCASQRLVRVLNAVSLTPSFSSAGLVTGIASLPLIQYLNPAFARNFVKLVVNCNHWNYVIDLLRSKTARNSYLNLIGLAVPLVIGVALVPITMRGLGIPRYGLLSLALTVLEYSALFALGLGPATTRYVAQAIARNDENRSDLIALSILGHTILGAIGGLIIIALAPALANHVFVIPENLRPEAVTVFRLIGVMVPATLLLLSLFGALEGASLFGLVNLLRIPISALSFIIPAVGRTALVYLTILL